MKIPLQVTFRHQDPSPALETRIRELVDRLEHFSSQILRCHVVVEPRPGHQRKGGLHAFRIEISLPDGNIAVGGGHPQDHGHEDAYVALRDAFRAARRKLEEYERMRRQEVKTHASTERARSAGVE